MKECLEDAAVFYVPDRSQHKQLVEMVLVMLGLKEQESTRVGGVFFRGLSGGQKRRLSIGVEIIAQPNMIFLDEPTSGFVEHFFPVAI